jgi:methyltransferase (TIGR00027 family)
VATHGIEGPEVGERAVPDDTAALVALWRAIHVQVDAPPHVLVDELGLELLGPPPGWRDRPDMHPEGTARGRASIVARARATEDELDAQVAAGLGQYVLLGAGLDTFARRRPDLASRLRVFEVDEPRTQAWKQRRLAELGWPPDGAVRFVPVDFEAGEPWPERLAAAGFDRSAPALVSSLGVAVYLTEAGVAATLRAVAALAPGSTLVLSYMLPLDRVAPEEQPTLRGGAQGASAKGTPWITFFEPPAIEALALAAGFTDVRHVSPDDLAARYFAGRADGLRPSSAEHIVIATTAPA